MRKLEESTKPDSCWNKATPHEMIFVLLGRDEAAYSTILHWCSARIELGKNKIEDKEIIEALHIAATMKDDFERIKASHELRKFENAFNVDAESVALTLKNEAGKETE